MGLHENLLSGNFPEEFLQYLRRLKIKENLESDPIITAPEVSEEVPQLSFNPPFLKVLEERTGLSFEDKGEAVGRVCYANTEEVLPEFRTTFSGTDLLFYLFSFFSTAETGGMEELQEGSLPLPDNSDFFWEKVRRGQEILGAR